MQKPKVSVIVPVYNVEKYLAKCLDSILNQTLKEIEVLVVNDGSKDLSLEIALHYKKLDNRILVFDKENGGLGNARNFGLNHAKGEYISFIDSDDYIEPEMLSNMYWEAKKHQSDIVFCALKKVNEEGKELAFLSQGNFLTQTIDLENDFSIFGEFSCFACNKLFKAELFREHRFRKMHFEDIELIPQLVLESKKISIVNNAYYNYLERVGSITKNHTEKGLDLLKAVERVALVFKNSKYKQKSVELRRFQILQGFYSFLAYVAFVEDKKTKSKMLDELLIFLNKNKLSRLEIIAYKRFGKNYLLGLDFRKKIFYTLAIVHPKILLLIKL